MSASNGRRFHTQQSNERKIEDDDIATTKMMMMMPTNDDVGYCNNGYEDDIRQQESNGSGRGY